MFTAMIVLMIILAGMLILVFAAKTRADLQFTKQVKELFSFSGAISEKAFHFAQLGGLPAPVQRYFKHVLKEGQPYINYARLTHSGNFKPGPDKKWIKILGEEYFTTTRPGFIWKGETTMFTAIDFYINGSAGLNVNLFSIYPLVSGKGSKFDQGELLRWLGESVWFPTNLLPTENLQWTSISNTTAKITFCYSGLEVYYNVTFNDKDEIVKLETKRYMGDGDLETWVGTLADYREINSVTIPFAIKAMWHLKQGVLPYVDFRLDNIEYDIPKSF